MANRSLASPKLLTPLRQHFIRRPLNSAAPSVAATFADHSPAVVAAAAGNNFLSPSSPPLVDLSDTERLFAGVPTEKLARSAANLRLAAFPPLVDLGARVMTSRLMAAPVAADLILAAVRRTFFDHFCAGESASAAAARAAAMAAELRMKGMLVYGVEHADDDVACRRNFDGFLETVGSARSLESSAVSFVIVKISAICPLRLLERASDLLRWEYNNSSFKLPWKHETLPLFTDSSPFYHTQTKPDPLTQEEEIELNLGYERLLKLCQSCVEANVPLCVDAEDTYVQPAIDYFTYSAALRYNKDDNPIIYNTIQTYLRDARERLCKAQLSAEKMGVPMGFKLVRGAYMSSERKLAASLGVESPIHGTIDQTHACFNGCASFMIDKVADGKGAVVLATHNIDSGNKAAAQARELGIREENQKLQFAQLYGMADALSFGLRNAGFQVSKYMPFGPVDKVLPYLLRRAEENRGFLSTSTIDTQLLGVELVRRLKAALHL